MVDWRGKLPAIGQYKRRDPKGIRFIVIHHSGADYDSSAVEIASYHVGLGFPSGGYQFSIRWDGTIEQSHDLDVMSYNVAGLNDLVVGICLVGDYTNRTPRKAQLEALVELIPWLEGQLPGAKIVGHKEIALKGYETECPGQTMQAIRRLLFDRATRGL